MASFTISAGPNTDIWRKPPHADVWNAPTANTSSGALQGFVSAKASFSFPWSEQYDQAGLLLSFRPTGSSADPSAAPPKWIKTGIEFYNGTPMLSTVAAAPWADWSVAPLTVSSPAAEMWTTIAIEKATDEHGVSLWVYLILDSGEKVALREICWVYGDKPEDWTLEVSAMAARPQKGATSDLKVDVKGFEVQWT
ncbi:hypothetical protein QBC34DRAFT_414201 [Podospora aff. communis PSN243]|uniref:Uncharacterized protein n=1 Tax=Podospora aff. communis PSN243 TaxID=3040156 RepID=A0AAV9G9T5_9PEZI|nr:hypothetical protein QBC34DRAFT_414201 [Podospora aff. communis PSN243]